jgi:phage-related protein
MNTKPVEFLGDSLDALRVFPDAARQDAGYQLDKVQHGLDPDDWKPMPTIGAGIRELRIRDPAGAFRVICLAKLANAVYVLHCFQKKAQRTSLHDIRLAKLRFIELMRRE